ncbi:gluconate 2-dehydrogenase subunit 3 family protein [Mycobacterium sp.]|uniref:gluconate 2-dehydrogenase subunit 3 family protein n=1 Tax=Mycobacterium sp. TaxID=1785 RepID=UPI003F97D53F
MPGDTVANGSTSSAPVSRRAVLGGLSLLPLAAMRGVLPAASADTGYRFLTTHQAAVLDAATRRLIPGPEDNLLEHGHPGAHEANVVGYLDTMLSAFTFSPPAVHAGGPWSNRAGGTQDYMADFVPLDRAQTYAWQQRIADYRQQYTNGIALLDQLAGGDFTQVSKVRQDLILGHGKALSFTQLLFGHTVEGMYAVPEYGGNANLVGWQDIKWPGDNEPRGYTDAEVEAPEWDVVGTDGIVGLLMRGGWQQAIAKMGGTAGVNAG